MLEFPAADLAACAAREVALRERVYRAKYTNPDGTLSPAHARELAMMMNIRRLMQALSEGAELKHDAILNKIVIMRLVE